MPMMLHPDCRCCQMACKEFDDYIEHLKHLPKEEYAQKIKEFFERNPNWAGHCQSCWNQFHHGETDKDFDPSYNPFKGGSRHG